MSIVIPLWLIIVVAVGLYFFVVWYISMMNEFFDVDQPWAGLGAVFWPISLVILILVLLASVLVMPFRS